MPAQKRHKTKYLGVYYIMGTAVSTGKPEKIYYIDYRKDGKRIQEKAGRQNQDDMTPATANKMRGRRIDGDELPNKARRTAEQAEKDAEANKWTITKLWEEYKRNRPGLKGLVTDQNRFGNHIEPPFGDKEPRELVPLDVDRFRIKMLKNRAPGTVKNAMELLRRIINFGVNKQLCGGPGFKIEMPRVNNLKTEDLDPDQLKNLLDAIDADSNTQAANLMRMALFTGMRRSEMFRLKWSDVDSERGFITLRDTKGGVDEKIPLNDATRDLLNSHPKIKKSRYVFPGRGGRQRTDIKHQVNRIRDAAGLPSDFRALHGLRHVFSSMLASSGKVDLFTLQRLLTHKSPLMTQRYAHLRDETLKKASNLAGDIVQQVAKTEERAENVVNLDDHKK
ncbi:MAG: site-specific integrase [Deltaproteobacteria bacterium]|nr:site-specific integrase [Deltaproteobacteria bacterium]